MTAFLLGFSPSLEGSGFLATDRAYQLVGDNTGNLAFCYAIDRQLGGGLKSVLWHADPSDIDALGDIGVITLANQLGSHANMGYLVDAFNRLQVRLVGIGLGAQAGHFNSEVEVPKGTLDWIRAIQDHSSSSAPNIAVRGEFSRRTLERYGLADKTVVLGCPTLFINPERGLGKRIAARFSPDPERVAVSAGHQRWSHLATLESSLVQIAQACGGAYICQSPLEMVQLGRGEAALVPKAGRDLCRSYAAPHMSDGEFINWCDGHALSFFSASAWLEYLRRFDFVVGTRIHGVMLALQAGVPGLCIAHDSRTAELCETMLVPYVNAQDVTSGIKRDRLTSYFKFDPDAFDANRSALAKRYVNFLRLNGLEPADYLLDICVT